MGADAVTMIAGRPGSAYCRIMDSELRAGEGLQWIDVALFRRLAGDDLNLWRDLAGRRVEHRDPRYGIGTIIDARWATFCEHVPEYIQLRVEYTGGLVATVRAGAMDDAHRSIEVPTEAADLAARCFGPDAALNSHKCEDAVAAYSELVRARFDQQRAARIAAKADGTAT